MLIISRLNKTLSCISCTFPFHVAEEDKGDGDQRGANGVEIIRVFGFAPVHEHPAFLAVVAGEAEVLLVGVEVDAAVFEDGLAGEQAVAAVTPRVAHIAGEHDERDDDDTDKQGPLAQGELDLIHA